MPPLLLFFDAAKINILFVVCKYTYTILIYIKKKPRPFQAAPIPPSTEGTAVDWITVNLEGEISVISNWSYQYRTGVITYIQEGSGKTVLASIKQEETTLGGVFTNIAGLNIKVNGNELSAKEQVRLLRLNNPIDITIAGSESIRTGPILNLSFGYNLGKYGVNGINGVDITSGLSNIGLQRADNAHIILRKFNNGPISPGTLKIILMRDSKEVIVNITT